MKRIFDFFISFLGIVLLSPIFIIFMILVFLQDFKSPFYVANRVGKNGNLFKMIKLRSMGINADKTGLASTSSNDMRLPQLER